MRRLKFVTEITQTEFFSQTEAKQSICLLMWPWERDMQEIRQTNLTDFDMGIFFMRRHHKQENEKNCYSQIVIYLTGKNEAMAQIEIQ